MQADCAGIDAECRTEERGADRDKVVGKQRRELRGDRAKSTSRIVKSSVLRCEENIGTAGSEGISNDRTCGGTSLSNMRSDTGAGDRTVTGDISNGDHVDNCTDRGTGAVAKGEEADKSCAGMEDIMAK